MKKNQFRRLSLGKGEMNVYADGKMKLYAYRTNDSIDDEVFVVAKEGRAVVIESPCFFDNNRELETFLAGEGLAVEGMLLSYHLAGGSFLPGVRKYATRRAEEYGQTGGGGGLIANFAKVFGESFDASKHVITDVLEAGETEIAGIRLIVVPTADAFDLIVPELNAVYTHMLGHDCHSIVAGAGHAQAMIAQLKEYLDAGYDLVLTSHYTPEDLKDVRTKIAYLEELRQLAAESKDAEEFKAKMRAQYPDYHGENYLDMTAGIFFA